MGFPFVSVSPVDVNVTMPGEETFPLELLVFFIVFYGAMLLFSLAMYILTSLGMYRMAKRRGIHRPWLAWIPVGNMWILGCISDQYQAVVKNKTTNRRGTLMGLYIASLLLAVIYMIFAVGFALSQNFAFLGGFLITFLAILAVSIAFSVFGYMSYFDFYRSADPDNAVLYLVLSIFVSVTAPFLIFLCGKKDGGMPARVEEAPAQLPETQPEEVPQPEAPEE